MYRHICKSNVHQKTRKMKIQKKKCLDKIKVDYLEIKNYVNYLQHLIGHPTTSVCLITLFYEILALQYTWCMVLPASKCLCHDVLKATWSFYPPSLPDSPSEQAHYLYIYILLNDRSVVLQKG